MTGCIQAQANATHAGEPLAAKCQPQTRQQPGARQSSQCPAPCRRRRRRCRHSQALHLLGVLPQGHPLGAVGDGQPLGVAGTVAGRPRAAHVGRVGVADLREGRLRGPTPRSAAAGTMGPTLRKGMRTVHEVTAVRCLRGWGARQCRRKRRRGGGGVSTFPAGPGPRDCAAASDRRKAMCELRACTGRAQGARRAPGCRMPAATPGSALTGNAARWRSFGHQNAGHPLPERPGFPQIGSVGWPTVGAASASTCSPAAELGATKAAGLMGNS